MISSATPPWASRCTASAASLLGAWHKQKTVPSASFLEAWGNEAIMAYHGSDGPDYTNAVRLEVAIKDFPRVHAHLSKKLETAEEALADENLSRSSTSAHEQRGSAGRSASSVGLRSSGLLVTRTRKPDNVRTDCNARRIVEDDRLRQLRGKLVFVLRIRDYHRSVSHPGWPGSRLAAASNHLSLGVSS